jgi:hypothetical protein
MKTPSQTQSTTTSPTFLANSILGTLSSSNGGNDSLVFPITMTNASSESEALQKRRKLRMILTSAIALLDGDDFDPIELPTMHQQLSQ